MLSRAKRRLLIEEVLRDIYSIHTWTFASYAHVEPLVNALPRRSRVLSLGGGARFETDRLLALRNPRVSFLATDLAPDESPIELPPNLSRTALDITKQTGKGDFDLVYSVECFEHIDDDELAMSNARTFVRRGGSLMIIVPFATVEQQRDPEFIRQESVHGHVRPGYDPGRLARLAGLDHFAEVRLESCYWRHTWALRSFKQAVVGLIGMEAVPALEVLARLDVRPGVLGGIGEACGIKLIAVGKR